MDVKFVTVIHVFVYVWVRGIYVCVCKTAGAGKCEEQFQMVTTPLRATEAEEGKTSQKESRAAQTEIEKATCRKY